MDGRKRTSPRLNSEPSGPAKRARSSSARPARSSEGARRRKAHPKPQFSLKLADLKRALLVGIIATAVATPVVLWQMEIPQKMWASLVNTTHGLIAHVGLRMEEVVIDGAKNATREEIITAMGITKGESLFAVDLDEVHKRLVEVPWVRDAQVQRRWPHTLYLRISEHRPIAYWQKEGELYLIDENGGLIETNKDIPAHNVPVLTGEDAPQKAPELLKLLQEFKDIQKRVSGAVYISKRRWDIILDGKLRIKLPETKVREALAYVVELEQKHQLSNKDIMAVDVRLPDRAFFSLTPEAAKEKKETKSKAA